MNVNNPRPILIEYINRDGDKLFFEKKNNIIMMTGHRVIRYSYKDNPNDLIMADPSGGPYIAIGTDMGTIDEKFNGLTVVSIKNIDKHILFEVN